MISEAGRTLADQIEADGVGSITYPWWVHGSVQDQGDARIAEVAGLEAEGVMAADLVVVLLPGGRGTHTELGMAIGFGKPVVIHGPEAGGDGRVCCFYRHPAVKARLTSWESLGSFIRAWAHGYRCDCEGCLDHAVVDDRMFWISGQPAFAAYCHNHAERLTRGAGGMGSRIDR